MTISPGPTDTRRHAAWSDPRLRTAALALYYGAIVAALLVLYGTGDLQPPSFVYQGF